MVHLSVELVHTETNGVQNVDGRAEKRDKDDSPGESVWHSCGVIVGSWSGERATMRRVPSM